MSKELCISSTPHETRLAIVEDDQLTEIYYERENEYTLAGSIYKGRVTRVLPGMQSAFVDIGLERDAFLYVTDFLEEAGEAADFERPQSGGRGRGGRQSQGESGSESGAEHSNEIRAEAGASTMHRDGRANGEGRSSSREGRSGRGGRGSRHASRQQSNDIAPVPSEQRISAEPSEGLNGDSRSVSSEGGAQDEFDQGTRRWRGRRGRRRGGLRAGGPREGAPTTHAASEPVSPPYEPEEADASLEYPLQEPLDDLSGIALSAQADSPFAAEVFNRNPSSNSSSSRPPRRDGRRDGRGGRSQGRSRETHSESLHDFSRESSQDYTPAPTGEPIFLPGESLSKYGQKAPVFQIEIEPVDRSDEKPLPVYTTAAPSTLVNEDALTWDGVSAALPGESLSKNRNRPQAAAAAPAVHAVAPTPDVATAPAEAPSADAGASHAAPLEILHAVHTPSGNVAFEGVAPHVEAPVEAHGEAPAIEPLEAPHEGTITAEQHAATATGAVEPEIEHVETEHEFEPDHASASYRVDPAAPSEFRIAAPVEGHPVQEPAIEASAGDARWDWQDAVADTGWEPRASIPSPETHGSFHVEATPTTEPVHDTIPVHEDSEETATEHARFFSPGTGLLEEEVIDEEEFDFSPIHGHSDEHDLEEIEEETLDSAAGSQLSDLVRDQHIQRRVSGEPAEGDEYEEDESEADGSSVQEELSGEDLPDDEGLAAEEEAADPHFAHSSNAHADGSANPAPRRDDNRRRDGGRDGGRGGRRNSNQRGRSGGGGRHTAQTSDLPIISDLLKQGQEVLVQIAKEPIAKKGARITSHIALPGRFLVFMPTVNHVGVSRKISSDEERQRLKRILTSEKGTATGGFIVRTAADGASEEELRADLRFLISLWTEIKSRSDNGKSPALIYHDLNLVERVLRDQVSDNFSTIWVDSEVEYERIVRFLNRFEPSLVRRVKLYTKEVPLFEQFGIQEEITKALRSKVWLKSGGSIVINQTEALVAIDINTGKYVGKTARLEDTIVKTNLDAIPEIVRQIRLRDLGGIIIIDFIDMDERKNRHRVMQALEDELKNDRAPSKVLQFNDFGLVAITRKRVKQSLERTLSTQCNICAGTGMVKSPVTVCNEIYTEMRKMHKNFDRGDVMLRVHPEIVKTLKGTNGKWLSELEEMIGRTILVKSDPALHPEQFDIH